MFVPKDLKNFRETELTLDSGEHLPRGFEIELTDPRGYPAGKASDYTQVIEPRQEWRFRALVLEDPKGSRAVAGKVSSIKEDD